MAEPLPTVGTTAQKNAEIKRRINGAHGETAFGMCWDSWYNYLIPYLPAEHYQLSGGVLKMKSFYKAFVCPSQPWKPDQFTKNAEWAGISYGMNTATLAPNNSTAYPSTAHNGWANWQRGVGGWPGYGVGIPGMHDNRRLLAAHPRPGETILLAEHRGVEPPKTMFVYWTDPPFIRPPRGPDDTDATPPTSWGTYQAPWPWTNDGFSGWAVRIAHRDRSAYLFLDGSVRLLTPWETCTPDPLVANFWTGR